MPANQPRFVDMISGVPGFFNTQAAALWDDEALYIAFWIEEPFVEARLTQRDSTIFQENDVEVFIDGGDCYYEFEINALNTVYEVFLHMEGCISQSLIRKNLMCIHDRPIHSVETTTAMP